MLALPPAPIRKCLPEHASVISVSGPTFTVEQLVDQLFKAYRFYKHTHTKASVMSIIDIAKQLQAQGYDLLIDANHKLVGAIRRKDANQTEVH